LEKQKQNIMRDLSILTELSVLSVTLSFIMLSAYIDAQQIIKKQYIINHVPRWLLRFTFFLAICVFNVRLGIASSLIFLSLFDQALNIELENPIFYLGTVAEWDKFFSKRKSLYVLVKVIALVVSLLMFFIF